MNSFPINVHEKILKCFWSQNLSELFPLKITHFRDLLLHSDTKYIDFVRIFFTAFYLLGEKYRVVEKFGISLRPEAHIRTSTALFNMALSNSQNTLWSFNSFPTWKRFEVLVQTKPTLQANLSVIRWHWVDLNWISKPKQEDSSKRKLFRYLAEWKRFKQKKLKSLKNFNTDTKSGTQKIEAS